MILLYLYKRLNILQQNSYKMYPKWIYKRYLIELLFYSVNLFYFNIYTYVFSMVCYLFTFRFKKKLKFTKRLIRLLIPIIVLIPLMNNYIIIERILVVFIDLFVYALLLINRFIEGFINKKYINEAKIKLNSFKGIKIGICGSYGKTTLKNYLYNTLKNKYAVFKTPYSYNTPLGICRCLRDIDCYDILLIEMGISDYGDSDKLIDLVNPDIVILNNIGVAHMNNFKSLEDLRLEKLKLLKGKVNFVGLDIYGTNIINYDVYGYTYKNNYVYKNNQKLFRLDLLEKYKIHNALGVIAIMDYLKIDINYISEVINDYPIVENRYKEYKYKDYTLIDNSFNSNYIASLEFIDSLNYHKMAIITDGFVDVDIRYNYLLFNKIYEKFNTIYSNNKLFKSDKTKKYKGIKKVLKGNYDLILIENDLNDYYRGII